METLTVVVASYRYGHLAAHCLESLQSQTVYPDEVLFVDDGVGDCGHLPKIYKDVKYTFREKNLGVVDNFQDMLSKVKTDKCMFLGADNWLRSDAIEILLKPKTDIVCYDIILTGPKKEDIAMNYGHQGKVHGDYYWSRSGAHHGSMVYNTAMAKSVGGYRGKNGRNSNEDEHLWGDLLKAGATVKHIKKGLLYYRRHHENYNKT
jgi:glycosyltransferase involved in cell wall biosynthesis